MSTDPLSTTAVLDERARPGQRDRRTRRASSARRSQTNAPRTPDPNRKHDDVAELLVLFARELERSQPQIDATPAAAPSAECDPPQPWPLADHGHDACPPRSARTAAQRLRLVAVVVATATLAAIALSLAGSREPSPRARVSALAPSLVLPTFPALPRAPAPSRSRHSDAAAKAERKARPPRRRARKDTRQRRTGDRRPPRRPAPAVVRAVPVEPTQASAASPPPSAPAALSTAEFLP